MAKRKLRPPKGTERASAIERADAGIGVAAARYRDTPAMRVAGAIAEVADQPPLIAIGAATIVGGLVLKNPRLTRAGIRMLAAELVATGMKAAVKRHVVRTRPHKVLRDGRHELRPDPDGALNDGPWNSFPSGHTAGAVAVGRALLREYPDLAPAVVPGAVAIGAVQPFIGAHFPADVAAGAIVGLAAEKAVDATMRRLDRSDDAAD